MQLRAPQNFGVYNVGGCDTDLACWMWQSAADARHLASTKAHQHRLFLT